MMANTLLRESWHNDDGLNLLLTCEGNSCLVEITSSVGAGAELQVDVLLQPTDSRGLAIGSPVVAAKENVQLQSLPNGERCIGRFWLPQGLSQRAARNCYFQVKQH